MTEPKQQDFEDGFWGRMAARASLRANKAEERVKELEVEKTLLVARIKELEGEEPDTRYRARCVDCGNREIVAAPTIEKAQETLAEMGWDGPTRCALCATARRVRGLVLVLPTTEKKENE